MTVHKDAYDTVIDCPHCRHSFDAVLDVIEDGAAWDVINKLKCPKCHGLLGVEASMALTVWDRSADQEG